MKRVILIFLALVFVYQAYSQCNPDPALNHSGISPNPLPDGRVGVAYSQAITFQFPTDTTVTVFGSSQAIHIDTLILQSVDGFPASFTKTCNQSGCKYYGATLKGCMQIAGTPVAADTGIHKLVISVIAKFKLGITPIAYPFTDTTQSFRVLPVPVGISRGITQVQAFGIDQISPNPFTEKTTVSIASPKATKATIAIRDLLGKEILVQEVSCKAGITNVVLNTEEFKAGYYLLSVASTEGVITRKITKR